MIIEDNAAVENNEQNADAQDVQDNNVEVVNSDDKIINNQNGEDENNQNEKNGENKNSEKENKKEKVFTQEEVNDIIKERLKRDREKSEGELSELENQLNTLQTSLKTEKITNELIKHNVREDRIDTIMKLGDFNDIDLNNISSKVDEVIQQYPEFIKAPDKPLDNTVENIKISTNGTPDVKTAEEKELERIKKLFNL